MGSQNSKVYEHQEYDRNNAEDIPFALDGKHPEIATGAFGTVHKVKGETGRFKGVGAARKVISFQATDLSTAKCKIKEEAEALRRARHGHVVSLIMTYFYNKSDNEADFVIIMHRADGSLQDYLADKDSRPHEQWFGCLMGAVAHIHRLGIRHRDIKPTNILVKDEKVLLADFGISKRQLGGKIVTTTPDQPRARTEAYCAPEVERGGTRGRLADIFSLGAVFLEMLLAHSYPDQFRELEDHVGSGNDKSYAKSIDKVLSWMISILPWMNDTEQDPDSVDWRATLLFLCWQMLHKDRDQRPKAEDLRSWWILQPSVLGLESCNCIRDPAADGPEHYKLGKINESLRRAYENGHRLMVDFLIQRGAAISDTDSLVAASKGEMLDAVKRLLEMGADVLGKDKDGRTALHYAAGRGHEGVVQLLLKFGADTEEKDRNGQTPLSRAAMYGQKATLKLLLERGANIDARDKYGETPLSRAMMYGQKATRKLLLERGANINARDEYGDAPLSRVIKHQYRQTPLLRAAIYGYEAIVRRLLDEGVDVNEKDGYRQTALLGAAMYGHEAVVKLLLEEGADISSCDIWGETPLSEAKKGRHKAVVNLLLDHSASIEAIARKMIM